MTSRRVLPALLLLFIGSGCAALIYEIVWFQLLQLVIGSSAISLGVVLGSVLAGFYLLRVYDTAIATYVAVAINVVVALGGLLIAKNAPYQGVDSLELEPNATRAAGAFGVYVVIALSGFTALGAEVIWTRLLSLLFGATTYTFSLILAVFLFGLGIGSSVGSAMASRITRPRFALGWCQLLLCASMAWTAYVLSRSLPYWPINPS